MDPSSTSRRWPAWLRSAPARWALRLLVYTVMVVVVLRWFEHRQVFQPSRQMEEKGGLAGVPFEDVRFTTSDGVLLHGWFYPATGQRRTNQVLLLCHGNAGNIGDRIGHARLLRALGAAVFLFDYRGYGRSEGRPSEEGTYLDAQAAHRWLVGRGFAPGDIVVLGESLGGGVAAELALRETVGGLGLVSTFTSVPDLGAELFPWLPVRWVGSIRYDTRSKLPRIRVPVVILHSRDDTLIRFRHAEVNFAAAAEPKQLLELAGDHNETLEVGPQPFAAGVRRLLDMASGSGGGD
jgi:fermentation-respiration switch protein FrsA (DUF1100 family)